jgi:hypothetical protein
VTGEEVRFNVTFNTPFIPGPDHVFFRPEVDLGNAGNFLWLSAPKPIVAPGTPFANDLQSWIRNDGPGALSPDCERIGTDVTHQGPFNASLLVDQHHPTRTLVPDPGRHRRSPGPGLCPRLGPDAPPGLSEQTLIAMACPW